MAHYHAHGDQSIYGTLINLVKQKYAVPQGNWGSASLVEDSKAASYRYTEVKLEPWVKKLVFEYFKFVPWEELELESEPLYLPSPVPIGLIGHGIIQGISFHRTMIPKYTFNDLIKRCIHLVEGKDENDCIIKPQMKACSTVETEPDAYKNLLTKGFGSITIIPDGNIKKTYIEILGRSPLNSFKRLISAAVKDPKTKKKKLNVYLDDLCDENINIRVKPIGKKNNIKTLANEIWDKYLISNVKFNNLFSNDKGLIEQFSIDDLIKRSYTHWSDAVLTKTIHTYTKVLEKRFEYDVIEVIRYIFETYKSHKIIDIQNHYTTLTNGKNNIIVLELYDIKNKTWVKTNCEITNKDIEQVCKKKSIQSLIEHKLDGNKINQEIQLIKNDIINNDKICYNKLLTFK